MPAAIKGMAYPKLPTPAKQAFLFSIKMRFS
jgi:hypothetical protein